MPTIAGNDELLRDGIQTHSQGPMSGPLFLPFPALNVHIRFEAIFDQQGFGPKPDFLPLEMVEGEIYEQYDEGAEMYEEWWTIYVSQQFHL